MTLRVAPPLVLAAAALAVYANSFTVPFLFDDLGSIPDNPSIQRPWSARVFSPPIDRTVAGRPVLNLSLALNWWWGGRDVRGYHAVNLAIHILAAWTLYGLVGRTLLLPASGGRYEGSARLLGLGAALAFAVHPLQTESVTYVVQRAESLVALFYLFTLFALLRGATERAGPWYGMAALSCLLGMGTKEVMVSAPLVALAYDRAFLAGSLSAAWKARRGLYLALFATWVPLALLVASTAGRGGSAGFGRGVAWWEYGLIQCWAIPHYLRLALWPWPLVLDYDRGLVQGAAEIAVPLLVLAGLAATTIVALRRWPAAGFLGFAFFAILAPSSSVVPIPSQAVAEHRMYLALAPVFVVLVLAAWRGGRYGLVAFVLWTATLGVLTVRRNEDYRSAVSIWSDTVAKRPENVRALTNLASALLEEERLDEARAALDRAGRLTQDRDPDVLFNRAEVARRTGSLADAATLYEAGLALRPNDASAKAQLGSILHNLALAFAASGQIEGAVHHYEAALALDPDSAMTRNGLGVALAALGREDEAAAQLETAVRLRPDYAEAENSLGNLRLAQGRFPEAAAHFRRALELRPDYADAENGLGGCLAQTGHAAEALDHYRAALRIQPDHLYAHYNAGGLLLELGRAAEALSHYEAAYRLQPGSPDAALALADVFQQVDRAADAVTLLEDTLRSAPDHPEVPKALAKARARARRSR